MVHPIFELVLAKLAILSGTMQRYHQQQMGYALAYQEKSFDLHGDSLPLAKQPIVVRFLPYTRLCRSSRSRHE